MLLSSREVQFEMGEDLSRRYGINTFYETSAKTGYNVEKVANIPPLIKADLQSLSRFSRK